MELVGEVEEFAEGFVGETDEFAGGGVPKAQFFEGALVFGHHAFVSGKSAVADAAVAHQCLRLRDVAQADVAYVDGAQEPIKVGSNPEGDVEVAKAIVNITSTVECGVRRHVA